MGSRRGRGEGGIGRRKDGSWYATVSEGATTDGKRARKYFYGDSKAEVIKARADYLKSRAGGFDPLQETLAEYLPRWLESHAAGKSLRPKTVESYEYAIANYLQPILGHVVVGSMTPAHVEYLLDKMRKGDASPVLQHHVYVVLKLAISRAVEQDRIARDPFRGLKFARPASRAKKAWTPAQAQQFLDQTRESRFWPMWVVALRTGLRQGEILGLRWENVDLKAGVLRVEKQMSEMGGRQLGLTDPKSKAGKRTIILTPQTIEALKVQQERMLAEGLRASPWVFPSTSGNAYFKSSPSAALEKEVAASGLPRITFHELRHTAITHTIKSGVDFKVVQERAGHSNIAITLGTYYHPDENTHREAAEKLAALESSSKEVK
jgi:integrase